MLVTTQDDREVWSIKIDRPYNLVLPFPSERYVCILLCHDQTVTDNERTLICEQLFKTGCRYGVFGGVNCEKWHEELDWVVISSDPDFDPPDEAFTNTTSHADESVEDTIFFGLECTGGNLKNIWSSCSEEPKSSTTKF